MQEASAVAQKLWRDKRGKRVWNRCAMVNHAQAGSSSYPTRESRNTNPTRVGKSIVVERSAGEIFIARKTPAIWYMRRGLMIFVCGKSYFTGSISVNWTSGSELEVSVPMTPMRPTFLS
jgi:hypothetical protein